MLRFKQFLTEGGGYGHLANFYELNYSFKDIKDFINDALTGKLERVKLKTDGANLLFTVINGRVRVARSPKHLKNYGQESLTVNELATKFSGRGIGDAYVQAVNDLQTTFTGVSQDKIDKMFKNGKKFMSVEVMHTEAENLISYGSNQLRFHGTKEYGIDGKPIGEDNQSDGDILAKWIENSPVRPNTYDIQPLQAVKLEPLPDLDKQKKDLLNMVKNVQKQFKLKDNDNLNDYRIAFMRNVLKKNGIEDERLARRWGISDKSVNIKMIKKDYSGKNLKFIESFEKNLKEHVKEMMLDIEVIILRLGANILKNLKQFMVLNPDKTVQKLRANYVKTLKDIENTKNPEALKKLSHELKRLEGAGGIDKIAGEEGITFFWKNQFMKLTGTFAPLNIMNNIMGTFK